MKHLLYIISIVGLSIMVSCGDSTTQKAELSYLDSLQQDSTVPKAYIELTKRIINDSSSADLFYDRAKMLMEMKKPSEALADIDRAVDLKPNDAVYLVNLGDIALAANKGSVAEDAYNKAIEIEPSYFEAYHKLSSLYIAVLEYLKAEILLKKLLDLQPNDKEAYLKIGLAKKYTQDTTAAIEYFKRAAELDDDYIEPNMQLGIIYLGQNNKKAITYFENVLRIDEFNDIALYNLGLAKQNIGLYKDAMEAYQKAINVNPSNRLAFHGLGYINLYHENYNLAIDFFDKAIALDPEFVRAYYHRGLTNEQLKDYQSALSDYRKALEFDPNFEPAQKSLTELENKQ